ncbi:hemerythrin domain-containing protein [Actinomadura sp. LD22]|uniref:Hemerythrin domain-containing protein n=1 Tax=Actinomadura physcomitrii TaxID=2650748 RepID=A0A6I4MPD1_9ACTN|nr:hemerythrin domain-containing protein [Actinomadura physcomitrii]MWA05954.1 hemerythrin domain-containing protein [Actinomadura physcomitrii]
MDTFSIAPPGGAAGAAAEPGAGRAAAGVPGPAFADVLARAGHAAFRRDLERLAAAAAAGRAHAPQVRAGWENLKRQLRLHHDLQEGALWPRVERAAAGRAPELGVVAELRAEYARIEPLVVALDAALQDAGRDPGEVASAVRALRAALRVHLRHEEAGVLALARRLLGPADWAGFAGDAVAACTSGSGGCAEATVPWMVDGIAPLERSRLLTALPPAVRELTRVRWEPRYRRRRLWSV